MVVLGTEKPLIDIAINTTRRLQVNQRWQPDLYHDVFRNRLYISNEQLPYSYIGKYTEDSITNRMPAGIKRVVFHGLSPMDIYLDSIVGSRWHMICYRLIVEIAKKVPSWRMKNHLYRRLGVNVDQNTIIAPNVSIDYIRPELVRIGKNVVVGEEAMLLTHLLYPNKMEIGPISIGDDCVVGVRALILPGVTIGDRVTISAYSVVAHDVPSDAALLAPKSCLQPRERNETTYVLK